MACAKLPSAISSFARWDLSAKLFDCGTHVAGTGIDTRQRRSNPIVLMMATTTKLDTDYRRTRSVSSPVFASSAFSPHALCNPLITKQLERWRRLRDIHGC